MSTSSFTPNLCTTMRPWLQWNVCKSFLNETENLFEYCILGQYWGDTWREKSENHCSRYFTLSLNTSAIRFHLESGLCHKRENLNLSGTSLFHKDRNYNSLLFAMFTFIWPIYSHGFTLIYWLGTIQLPLKTYFETRSNSWWFLRQHFRNFLNSPKHKSIKQLLLWSKNFVLWIHEHNHYFFCRIGTEQNINIYL